MACLACLILVAPTNRKLFAAPLRNCRYRSLAGPKTLVVPVLLLPGRSGVIVHRTRLSGRLAGPESNSTTSSGVEPTEERCHRAPPGLHATEGHLKSGERRRPPDRKST